MQKAISEMPQASVCFFWKSFLLSSKWNSFSQESFCTWPRFTSEGFWNSEVAYSFISISQHNNTILQWLITK